MTEAGGIAKSLTCFNEDPHFQRVMRAAGVHADG